MDLSDLIWKWENSALELRQAESLINLLIVDNKRLEKQCARLGKRLNNVVQDRCVKCGGSLEIFKLNYVCTNLACGAKYPRTT